MLGLPAVSKREVLAAMFVQGLLAGNQRFHSQERAIEEAIKLADLLILALNKSKP